MFKQKKRTIIFCIFFYCLTSPIISLSSFYHHTVAVFKMSYICSTCFKNHNRVILFRNWSLFLHLSMSNVMALEETEKKHILIHSHQLFFCSHDIHHNCPFTTKPVSIPAEIKANHCSFLPIYTRSHQLARWNT